MLNLKLSTVLSKYNRTIKKFVINIRRQLMKNKNIKGELYNIFDNLIYSSFDNVADKVKNNKGVVLNMKKKVIKIILWFRF